MSRDTWFTFFALLAVGANVATLSLWTLALAGRASARAATWLHEVRASLDGSGLAIAALVASVATAGSLYLSEGADLVPCEYCWYQRIAMYPLAVVLSIAAVRRDWGIRPYALVIALVGASVSAYHYWVQRFPPAGGGSCDPLNPCTDTLIWKFHHVSIPFMAGSGFLLIATVLLLARPDTGSATGARDDDRVVEEVG